MKLEDVFTRRWVCNVTNQRCTADNPHDEEFAGCGFRYVASLTDEEFAALVQDVRDADE